MARTVWLASYPKSGNTWLRIFLANLLHPEQAPVDLNDLPESTPIASSRGCFDDLLGVPSALLTWTEIDRLRPAADAELARTWDAPRLLRKAHDGYRYLSDGCPLLGAGPDFAAIYLLRDPWDVAVSMTNHFDCTLEQAVANLCNPAFAVAQSRKAISGQLRQELGTWDAHAIGWLQAPLPLCLLRYEAMQTTPLTEFRRAVRFLGLTHTDDAIAVALEASRFERLQRQEVEQRFRETPQHASSFFRRGQVGEGLACLTEAQLEPLAAMHRRVQALIDERGLASQAYNLVHPTKCVRLCPHRSQPPYQPTEEQGLKNLDRITLDPAIMGGKPCIRGLRMTVGTVLGLMATGVSRERILQAYPYLEPQDLDAALAYAAWRVEEREEVLLSA